MRLDHSAESEHARRNTFLVALAVVSVFFSIVAARLWYLQVVKGDYHRELSENNRLKSYRIPAPRGRIRTRDGQTLVDYAPSYDVYYAPENLPEDPIEAESALDAVAQIIGVPREDLDRRIAGARRGRPVRVLTDASQLVLSQIEEARMLREGRFPLDIDTVSKRVYLHVGMLAHFLGYCGEIDEESLARPEYADYRAGDLVGQSGVERAFEASLHGRPGRDWYEENAGRTRRRLLNQEKAVPGNDLVLSIDYELQRAAMLAFTERAGAIVAVEPDTGFLLAAHSAPTFDVEVFSREMPRRLWQELTSDPLKPLQNRVIGGTYPPGSTFKPLLALAALEEKAITPQTGVGCAGVFHLGGYPFRCWKRGGHGGVDLHRAIRESCDVYFYTVGNRLGIDRITKWCHLLGLGRPTGIGLVGEAAGVAPDRAWKKQRFGQQWMAGDTISISIGQGYNVVTPLQLAMAYAALVNGGRLMRPQVALRVEDFSGNAIQRFEPILVHQLPADPANLETVRRGMIAVVEEPGGTARRARVPGVVIGGKTGTAQVVVQRGRPTPSLEETAWEERDHAWFVGFGPAEHPKIVVAAIAEHAGHGGSAAAPIVQKLLENYLTRTGDARPAAGPVAAAAVPEEPAEDPDAD